MWIQWRYPGWIANCIPVEGALHLGAVDKALQELSIIALGTWHTVAHVHDYSGNARRQSQ
jgi:hypothetical protein